MIIPAAFRRKLGIDTGDTVIVELDENGLDIRSLASAVRLAQEIVREFVPVDVDQTDELVTEPRPETD